MTTERTDQSGKAEIAAVAEKFAVWAGTLTPAEQGILWDCLSAARSPDDEVHGYNTSRRPDFSWSMLFYFDPTLVSGSSGGGGRGPRP
jgi:hypothetical protein